MTTHEHTINEHLRTWHEAEWFDARDGEYAEAWDAVDPAGMVEASAMKELDGRWTWSVKGTSAYAEWPELIDLGGAATMNGAMRAADRVARKVAKTHKPVKYD